jgi:hypothetical protein
MSARRFLTAVCALTLASAPAVARVDMTFDAATLNDMLRTMAPGHVDVDLPTGRSLRIQMKDMKVTGFDPAAGPNGAILTSVRLLVPELGIDTPVAPKLTLEMKDVGGKKACVLRFEKVNLNLPLAGAIDIASLVPPVELLPDAGWTVETARGPVLIKPNLIDAKTGAKSIRVGFDLAMEGAGTAAAR